MEGISHYAPNRGFCKPLADCSDVVSAGELKDDVLPHRAVASGNLRSFQEARANLLQRHLRAQIVFPDHEDDALNEAEGVVEHEGFHLTVVLSAPIGAFQEGEADLDLALFRFQVVITRAADDLARLALDHRESAFGVDRSVEKPLEDLARVTVVLGMLFPDQWVACRVEERVEVRGRERAQFDELAGQNWLQVEIHVSAQSITVTRQPRRWHAWNYW